MGAVDDFLALDESTIDVEPMSLDQLQEVFPTQEDAQAASAAAAAPSDPVSGALDVHPDRVVSDFLAIETPEQEPETPGALSTKEGQRAAAQLATGVALSSVLGPLGIPARVAGNAAISGGVDFTQRLLQGEDTGDALQDAAITGGVMGGAEALAPIPGKVLGFGYRGIRSLVRSGRQTLRQMRGALPSSKIPTIERASRPFENFLEEGAEEAFADLAPAGALPPVGQLVEHNLADMGQNIAENAIIGGQGIRAQRELSIKTARKLLVDEVENLPQMSRQEVGQLVEDLATGRLKRLKGVARGMYRRADRLMRGGKDSAPVMVDISNLKKLYAKEFKAARGGKGNALIKKWNDALQGKPNEIPFADAQRLRSDLFDDAAQANPEKVGVLTQAQRVASRAKVFATRAMREASRKAPAEARVLLRKADEMWRMEVRGELTSTFMQNLLRKQPEDMLDAIIRTGSPGTIRMIRDIVAKENPAVWDSVQGAFLNRALVASASTNPVFAGGRRIIKPDGAKFQKIIEGVGREDEAALKAMFPGESRKILTGARRHANTLRLMEQPPGGKASTAIWFNLGQAGAIGSALGGAQIVFGGGDVADAALSGSGTAVAAFFLTPLAIARIYRNPEMVRWLTIGAKAAPGSRPFWKAPIALAGLMLRENLLNDEQSQRAVEFINDASKELAAVGGQP